MQFLLYAPVLFLIGAHVRATSLVIDEEKWQHLEHRLSTYEQKIDDQQATIDKLQECIERLGVPSNSESDSNLEQGQWHSITKSSELSDNVEPNNGTVSSGIQVSNGDRIDLTRRVRRDVTNAIGFMAYLDHSVTIQRGQLVIFNEVLTNVKGGYINGYNRHSGVFTCPVSGLYIFSFAVASRNTNEIWARLTVNGVPKADAVADGRHDGGDMQGGNTGIFYLSRGDTVYVKVFDITSSNADVTHSAKFNTFSGALLFAY